MPLPERTAARVRLENIVRRVRAHPDDLLALTTAADALFLAIPEDADCELDCTLALSSANSRLQVLVLAGVFTPEHAAYLYRTIRECGPDEVPVTA